MTESPVRASRPGPVSDSWDDVKSQVITVVGETVEGVLSRRFREAPVPHVITLRMCMMTLHLGAMVLLGHMRNRPLGDCW